MLATDENRNAVYLCEQAAEKVIRAVVTSEGKHAGIKHELAEMVDLIPDENPLKPGLRAIEHLSQYATAYRYPVSSSKTKRIPRGPTPDELREVIDATTAALEDAVRRFRVDLHRDRFCSWFLRTDPLTPIACSASSQAEQRWIETCAPADVR